MNKKMTALLLATSAATGVLSAAEFSVDQIDIHGFISQGYMMSSDYNFQTLGSKNGSFEFSEMGLNFSTDLSDNLRAGLQIISRDFGTLGNNDVHIDWAYGDYSFSDNFGLRLGRIKTPMGFYNETRDIDMIRTSVLLPQSVYNETFRDFMTAINGAEIYGIFSLADAGSLQYRLQVGTTGFDSENNGMISFFESQPGTRMDEVGMGDASSASLVWLSPVDGLRIGTSINQFSMTADGAIDLGGSYLTTDIELDDARIYTLSTEYMRGDWTFSSEGQYIQGEADLAVNTPGGVVHRPMILESWGAYGAASRRLSELVELGGYYSYTKAVESQTDIHDIALTSRFDLTDNWLVKLEAHCYRGGTLIINPTNNDGRTADDDDWYMLAIKTTFNF